MSAARDLAEDAPPAWSDGELRSPVTGLPLRHDGQHALIDDAGGRWPVIDGIPFLRLGREALVQAALAALDADDTEAATSVLLADRDDWASGPGAEPAALDALVANRDALSFRDAMRHLAFGPVADYFAHRWSDPTFLSGLALAQAHWRPLCRVTELACGAGHFLRAFASAGAAVTGLDVVFSKLWLARHWVAPEARLLCCDATRPWPVADRSAELVFCHDALYFLTDKAAVVAEMRRVGDTVLCGHAHNAEVDNFSSGAPLSAQGYADLLGVAQLYDDAELTAALVARRAPRPMPPAALRHAAAISIAAGTAAAGPASGELTEPRRGTLLRRNPLYDEVPDGGCERRFPSERYAAEYGPLATYPERVTARREVVAGADPGDDALIRRRVWLDLPERW